MMNNGFHFAKAPTSPNSIPVFADMPIVRKPPSTNAKARDRACRTRSASAAPTPQLVFQADGCVIFVMPREGGAIQYAAAPCDHHRRPGTTGITRPSRVMTLEW